MKATGVLSLGLVALVLGGLGWGGIRVHDDLVACEVAVDAQWSQVENQLASQHDLIPSLVAVTRAHADLLDRVIDGARARGIEVLLQVMAACPPGYRVQFSGLADDDPRRAEALRAGVRPPKHMDAHAVELEQLYRQGVSSQTPAAS